jgi:hypothetical protein
MFWRRQLRTRSRSGMAWLQTRNASCWQADLSAGVASACAAPGSSRTPRMKAKPSFFRIERSPHSSLRAKVLRTSRHTTIAPTRSLANHRSFAERDDVVDNLPPLVARIAPQARSFRFAARGATRLQGDSREAQRMTWCGARRPLADDALLRPARLNAPGGTTVPISASWAASIHNLASSKNC